MFNPAIYENSRPDGFSVLEIIEGLPTVDDTQRFVPLRTSLLTGVVVGPLADLVLAQSFLYRREQSDRVIEAAYRFPLPGDAAVTGVSVRFGQVEIVAELKARDTAEQEYAEAKAQGKQAALLTREAPDVFTLQVAGIHPDEEVVVTTSYVQLARAEGTGWSLRFPLTTAPRFVRQDDLETAHAKGQPFAIFRDPGHRFSLDLTLYNANHIDCSTHTLRCDTVDGDTRVRLADGEVLPIAIACWRGRL